MEEQNWFQAMQAQTGIKQLLETNERTQQYGLVLSPGDAQLLATERGHTLKEQRRVEFGTSILPRIIDTFCDSAYLNQENYVETLVRLQDIFFLFQNEMHDEITDDELLHFMAEQFETVCAGDLDYLEGTCLEIFAQAIRAGYCVDGESDGYGEFAQFDPVQRWDHELFTAALMDLF